MNITIPQILLALLAGVSLVNGVAKYVARERSQTLFKLVASVTIWGSILVFALFPDRARAVSRWAGFGENLNTLIFIGFIIVFVILFRLLAIIERLERNVSEIVRKKALEDLAREKDVRGPGQVTR